MILLVQRCLLWTDSAITIINRCYSNLCIRNKGSAANRIYMHTTLLLIFLLKWECIGNKGTALVRVPWILEWRNFI